MERIITEEQFKQQIQKWAKTTQQQARTNAAVFSKGKTKPHTYIKGRYAGKTERKLKNAISFSLRKYYGDISAISFKMPVHGIFREYGVGNGQPRNRVAIKSGRAASMHSYIKRTPSDFLHNPIEKNIPNLSDMVADYYGDKILIAFKNWDVNVK